MKTGLILISLILLGGYFAPALSGHQPLTFDLSQRLLSPSSSHFFGTDENGVDVLTKILYGARLSVFISFTVVGISVFIGLILGCLSGYIGGLTDLFIMRFIDMLQAFPSFLIALALIAFIGPSIPNLIFALCITGWTAYARLVRGEIAYLKKKEFVQAAVALGTSDLRIIIRHIIPNLMAVLSVQMSFGLAAVVISEAGLSFLGLGAPPSTPSWGALLSSGRKYIVSSPSLSLFPGMAILVLVLGFNLLGDGLRRHFDSSSRS
jgi:peptide/nickel transport system permease protein